MKKILVPCDFSDEARQAFKFAKDIADANNGEIVVLKVIDLSLFFDNGVYAQPFYVSPATTLAELSEDAQKDFEKLIHEFPGSVPVKFLIEQGDLQQNILKTIEQKNIDLVVMGTKGATGLKEILIGSNTEKIVRTSPVPVFSVHHAMPLSKIKDIVFPTNLDLKQTRLIEKLKTLQAFFGATVHLLFIHTSDEKIVEKETYTSLDNLARFYQLDNFTVNIRENSHLMNGILKFASEFDYCTIAMATKGHKGLTHLFMGSTAEDVANHGHEPIWTFMTGHDEQN